MELNKNNRDEILKSLEGITEDEFKRILRKHYRAKHEEEKNPPHKPKSVEGKTVTPDDNNVLRYAKPKRQAPEIGREDYTGQETLTDKLGYMPLLDRLLQMQRGGESLHQMRTYMAEYSLQYRKEAEQLAKANLDDWPMPIDTYAPDIAQIQEWQKQAQHRVAAKVKARMEEAYRAKQTLGVDTPKKTPAENAPEAPEGEVTA